MLNIAEAEAGYELRLFSCYDKLLLISKLSTQGLDFTTDACSSAEHRTAWYKQKISSGIIQVVRLKLLSFKPSTLAKESKS